MRGKNQGGKTRAISRRIIFKDYSPSRERKLFRSINIAQPANWIKENPFKGILERTLSRKERTPRVGGFSAISFHYVNEPRDKSSSSNSWHSQSSAEYSYTIIYYQALRDYITLYNVATSNIKNDWSISIATMFTTNIVEALSSSDILFSDLPKFVCVCI